MYCLYYILIKFDIVKLIQFNKVIQFKKIINISNNFFF